MGHRHLALLHCLAWATAAIAALAAPPAAARERFRAPAGGRERWHAPAAARERWHAPVEGPVARPFRVAANPFAPGNHRGADFEAAPGTAVHAACSGRVVVAGRVGTSGRLVTIACGPFRATHMPLATVAVHRGARVRRGAELGTAAPSREHAGVHLGARRAGERFGYVDPLGLIGADPPPPFPIAGPRARPSRSRPAPAAARIAPPAARIAPPATRIAPAAARVEPPARLAPSPPPLAPWPAWAGLATLLAGAIGTGVHIRVRTRAATVPAARIEEAR